MSGEPNITARAPSCCAEAGHYVEIMLVETGDDPRWAMIWERGHDVAYIWVRYCPFCGVKFPVDLASGMTTTLPSPHLRGDGDSSSGKEGTP